MSSVRRPKKRSRDRHGHLIVQTDPKAIASEAFRSLRTNLQFSSVDQQLKTILFTSPGPGDGKSTVVSNLAVAWAQSGQRVVLVGCDLRKPVLHRIFPMSNTPGLTGYLTGQASLEEIIVPSREVSSLDLIPSGPVPPSPADLLQSRAMIDAIAELRERYDLVLFDGAPAVAVTDAVVIANQVDGTVLVVRANEVPRDVALHAKQVLEQANARILGVVLNGVNPKGQSDYHYYYYYNAERA